MKTSLGTLLSMDASSCGMVEKGSKTVAGEILGTDAKNKSTQEVLCQEYVLQGIIYRIRPMETKHPNLLPVGVSHRQGQDVRTRSRRRFERTPIHG
jgi:hypothetical protein